ncbi:MAG TPA: putative zinc-binding protein, partial [Spirochaetia bacterium]|nr:putative zinc-binding protein [Spirochaetia bacterium]
QSAQSATRNIVLDGCPVACGAKIFQKAGIPFQHHILTEYGVEKGKTPITGDVIEDVAARVAAKVRA